MEKCVSECLQLCVEIESEINNEDTRNADDVGDVLILIKSSGEEFVTATAVTLNFLCPQCSWSLLIPPHLQLGLVLIGRKVESIVPGGPAFHSQQISIGDSILEIDGTATTEENIGDLILGGDEPGTPVSITIRKEDSKVLRSPFFVLSLQSAVAV
jgi:hypothetical protein